MSEIGAALIGAGSSLLGGLLGGKTRSAGRNFRSHINGLMAAAEQHKINPLALLGMSPIGPSTSVNPLGAAIADAGAIAADGILRNSAAQKLERAERLNAKLSQDLTDATLRPKIPGVYAAGGSVAATSGGAHGKAIATNPYDRAVVSPFAGSDGVHVDDSLTGPQASVKKDVPAFRFLGHDFYGSGLFSTGQQIEDSAGEGPGSWAWAPIVFADAAGNEAYKFGRKVGEAAKRANKGLTPGERVRGKGSAKSGKGRAREVLGMFPTLGPLPNPWFDQPLKYRY